MIDDALIAALDGLSASMLALGEMGRMSNATISEMSTLLHLLPPRPEPIAIRRWRHRQRKLAAH